MLISKNDKKSYEIWKGRSRNVSHFRVLEASDTSKEKMVGLESLTPKFTKEYFSGTQEK
jgi:hypothetical protein